MVAEYTAAMAVGPSPPVVVFYDGVNHWLADGFHRTHAARRATLKTLPAEIHDGTKRDAVLYSVGANSAHGLRRTNADKRKAVMTLLQDEEWSQWSDREIARHCAVDHTTVGRFRKSLVENTSENPPALTTKQERQKDEIRRQLEEGEITRDEANQRFVEVDPHWHLRATKRTYTNKHGTKATMKTGALLWTGFAKSYLPTICR